MCLFCERRLHAGIQVFETKIRIVELCLGAREESLSWNVKSCRDAMKDSEGAKVVEVDTEGSTELPHQVAAHHCFQLFIFMFCLYFHNFKTSPGDSTSLFSRRLYFETNNDTCCQVEKGTDGSFVFSGK